MKTYHVEGRRGTYNISIPTSAKEITPEYLLNVTADITPAPHWSVVALISKAPLNQLLTSMRKKSNTELKTVPVFVKTTPDENDSEFIKSIKPGNVLVCSISELSMGNHVNCKYNDLSIDKILSLMEGDMNITRESLQNQIDNYFVSFKIIPNSNIHGVVSDDIKVDIETLDKFIVPSGPSSAMPS